MAKERWTLSTDEEVITSIHMLSIKTGLSKSYIATKYLKLGLAEDLKLTLAERYFFQKSIILDKMNIMYKSLGMTNNATDIKKDIYILSGIPDICFSTGKEFQLFSLSILHILEDIKRLDRELYLEVSDNLKRLSKNFSISSESLEGYISSEKLEDSEKFQKVGT